MNSNPQYGEPIYISIALKLQEEILVGINNPGDMLASENTLAVHFSTSRETIRKSLKELEHQGLIYSRPGKGYFVAEPEHHVFSMDFAREDLGFVSKHNEIMAIRPPEFVRIALDLPLDKRVIKIGTLLLKHNEPVAYDTKYLPYDKGTPIIESEIKYAVFSELAQKKATPYAFYTRMYMGAEPAEGEALTHMHCEPNESLLVIHRYVIGVDEQKICYGKKYMRNTYGMIEALSGYRSQDK